MPDGRCSFFLRVRDTAQNVSEAIDTGLNVLLDRAPPDHTALDVSAFKVLVAENGSIQTGATGGTALVHASLSVDEDPFSAAAAIPLDGLYVDPNGVARVDVFADPAGATLISSIYTAALAEERLLPSGVLPASIKTEVYLGVVDNAGNASHPVRVPLLEIVSTLNGRIPGDDASNPNSVRRHTFFFGEASGGVELTGRDSLDPTTVWQVIDRDHLPQSEFDPSTDFGEHDRLVEDPVRKSLWAKADGTARERTAAWEPEFEAASFLALDSSPGTQVRYDPVLRRFWSSRLGSSALRYWSPGANIWAMPDTSASEDTPSIGEGGTLVYAPPTAASCFLADR